MPDLYYHIIWPNSQKWMDQEDAVEDGLVIGADDGNCFVRKEFYEYIEDGL